MRAGHTLALSIFAVSALAGAATAQSAADLIQARPAGSAADHAVDASAVSGAFAIGAEVRDRNGASMGHVARLTTDKNGQQQLMVRKGVDSFAIPAAQVRIEHGVAVSALTREELKAQGSH
jgi:hypothetical protein